MSSTHLVGVISDTHGLLRPQALEALQGVDLIVHAGDVGDPTILNRLQDIAPVHAIRGNVDTAPWAQSLPPTQVVEVDAVSLYVLHDRGALNLDPRTSGFHAVIFGHSHRPLIDHHNDVLFLNPGSAGPRRFDLPITLARLHVENTTLNPELIHLNL